MLSFPSFPNDTIDVNVLIIPFVKTGTKTILKFLENGTDVFDEVRPTILNVKTNLLSDNPIISPLDDPSQIAVTIG